MGGIRANLAQLETRIARVESESASRVGSRTSVASFLPVSGIQSAHDGGMVSDDRQSDRELSSGRGDGQRRLEQRAEMSRLPGFGTGAAAVATGSQTMADGHTVTVRSVVEATRPELPRQPEQTARAADNRGQRSDRRREPVSAVPERVPASDESSDSVDSDSERDVRRQKRRHGREHRRRRRGDRDETERDSQLEASREQARAVSRSRKEVRVDNYAGDTSVEAYLTQFQLIAEHKGLPRSQWAKELAMRLRGEARNLVLLSGCTTDMLSFEELSRRLRARFGAVDTPYYHIAQLRGRARKEKESVPELHQWVMAAGAKAYPDVEQQVRDRILTDYFVNALTDDREREYVLNDEPHTVNDAAKAALKYEGIHRVVKEGRSGGEQSEITERGRKRHIRALTTEAEPSEVKSRQRERRSGVTETDVSCTSREASVERPRRGRKVKMQEPVSVAVAAVTAANETLVKKLEDEQAKTTNALLERMVALIEGITQEQRTMARRLEQVSRAESGRFATQATRPEGRGNDGGTGPTCYTCGRKGHIARNCRSGSGRGTCYTCGIAGHFAAQCPNGTGDTRNEQGNGTGRGSQVGAGRPRS